jgi:hypothetical protein
MKFPIIELIDRYAIAKLKWQKTESNKEELDFYTHQISGIDTSKILDLIDELTDIHMEIWNLEWQLKQGVEDQLPLAEIGRRAIKIRDYNNKRVAIKNKCASMMNSDIIEVKTDHLSS